MANRTLGRLLLTALGVSLLAGAGQLGVAFGFGVVRLTGVFTGGTVNQWPAQLAWVGWFAANAAVIGAVLTERLARRDGPLTGTARQLAVAGAAALGATVVAPLCMQPARAAELISMDPVWAVAICAILGAGAGAGAALAVLVRPPLGWNMALVAGVVWLLALVSVTPSLTATGPLTTVRLGVLEPAWLGTAAAQRLALLVLPLVALLAGATTGALARWRGHPALIGGLTGVAGPALLAFAYLTAGPGGGVDRYQTTPYYGALLAVAAGALGSAAAALLRWPLVERPAAVSADTPAARAIEPTDILRPLPAGPPLPGTAATAPSAGTAGDAGHQIDDARTPAGGGDAPGTGRGGRAPETPGGPTPAHWDWPTPGRTSSAAAATAPSTPAAAPPAPTTAPSTPTTAPPAPAAVVSGPSARPPAPPAPAGPPTERARPAGPAGSAAKPATGAADTAAPAGAATEPATGAADAAGPATPAAATPAGPTADAAGAAGPATPQDEAARPARSADGAGRPARATDDTAGPVVPAGNPPRTGGRAKAADRAAPAAVPDAAPAKGETAPRPRRGRRTKATPAKAAAAASPTADEPAVADQPPTRPANTPQSATDRSGPAPAAARGPVPSGPPPTPPTPAVPARPAPTQVGPDPSSRPDPTPVTPPRPTPTPVGPEPFAALPAPAQPAPRPVTPDPFTPPAPGSARAGDGRTAETAPRPRHRAPLPDLTSSDTWDAFPTARRPDPTETRPVASQPAATGGDASPAAAAGPVSPATGGDSTASVADRLAAAFAGGDNRPAGASSPATGQVAGAPAADPAEGRPEPKRRGLFRRNRSRADQADASSDAEPLAAQDEEFVDWVAGLGKPLPDNEPEQESGRRSLRSTGRHHRD
ncbi:hypothetical protein ACN26Y_11370 [Micromonospora sp. WMMD558]|uniref:hypothetical protein n=1 Tax=unclassified Micromonospora TaxID=2617518 RepID=UPI0012B4C7C0|nr:hypothetical protein [Micromonospora sp. WMMC415]QGN46840.1 hypothetical protein GKC29_08265 [Micromonospora sp. WMMC415]